MRTYETTFVINPQSDDTAIDQHVQAVTDLIAENGGTVLRENRIGTRRLAYEIQKLNQGYYTDLIFEGPQDVLDALDRFYKLEEPYIRHLTIRFDGELPPEKEEVAETESEETKTTEDKKSEESEKPAAAEKPAEDETAVVAETPAETAEPVVAEKAEAVEAAPAEEPAATEPVVEEKAPETAPEKPAGEDDIL